MGAMRNIQVHLSTTSDLNDVRPYLISMVFPLIDEHCRQASLPFSVTDATQARHLLAGLNPDPKALDSILCQPDPESLSIFVCVIGQRLDPFPEALLPEIGKRAPFPPYRWKTLLGLEIYHWLRLKRWNRLIHQIFYITGELREDDLFRIIEFPTDPPIEGWRDRLEIRKFSSRQELAAMMEADIEWAIDSHLDTSDRFSMLRPASCSEVSEPTSNVGEKKGPSPMEFDVAPSASDNQNIEKEQSAQQQGKTKIPTERILIQKKKSRRVKRSEIKYSLSSLDSLERAAGILRSPEAQSMPVSHRVQFTVTSAFTVKPGDMFIVDVWAHLNEQRKEVIERFKQSGRADAKIRTVGPSLIPSGTSIYVLIDAQDVVFERAEGEIYWEGEIANLSFPARASKNAEHGTRLGHVRLYVKGANIATVDFEIHFGPSTAGLTDVTEKTHQPRQAFASYASSDWDEVKRCIQGMQQVAPKLKVFVDRKDIPSGEYWRKVIEEVIPQSDVFFLFWSENAAKSEEVDREWRYAYNTKGIDFISPVAIDPPEKIPPPKELSDKHFNHWTVSFKSRQAAS